MIPLRPSNLVIAKSTFTAYSHIPTADDIHQKVTQKYHYTNKDKLESKKLNSDKDKDILILQTIVTVVSVRTKISVRKSRTLPKNAHFKEKNRLIKAASILEGDRY